EALYLELMIRRAPRLRARLRRALAPRPVRAALVSLVRTTPRILDEDPFYRRLLTHPDELAAVARRMGPEQVRRIEPHVLGPLTEFVERAQAAGELVAAPPASRRRPRSWSRRRRWPWSACCAPSGCWCCTATTTARTSPGSST